MKKFILLFTVGLSSLYFSQTINALTDEGQEVVLFADKSWKFVNESDKIVLDKLPKNSEDFLKGKNATFLLKSKKINTGVYIDPTKWQFKNLAGNTIVDYQLVEKSGNGYGLFGSEKTNIANYTIYKDIILSNLKNSVLFFRLLKSEVRKVNGKEVLHLRYKANIQNLDFEYVGYYFISEQGLSQIVCYSSEKMFEEFLPGFMELMNGFVETDEKSSVYELPPPPMIKHKN